MKMQLKAELMLLLITAFWGVSNLLIKIALRTMNELDLISLRFVIGFFLAAIVCYKHLLKINFKTVKYAFILSCILFVTYIAITYGVKYTSVSNAGFLTSLSVVCIPIFSAIFLKQKIERKLIMGIGVAVVGIGLLTLNGEFSIGMGDLLCLFCAFLYAMHIIVTGLLTKDVDSIALGVLQMGFVALFSTVFTLFIRVPKLPTNFEGWFSLLTLSILCTAVAFVIQTIAQQHTSSTRAGLIFSLEPIFSAVLAFFFIGEVLTLKGYIGAVLLLMSVVIVEIDFPSLLKQIFKGKVEKTECYEEDSLIEENS